MPRDFTIRLQYFLLETGLVQETSVINHSGRRMPLFLGFHTTFNLFFARNSKAENIRVYADISQEIARNMTTYLPTGSLPGADEISIAINRGTLDPTAEPISRHYRSGSQGKMAMYDTVSGLLLQYKNDKKFGWRLIYNGDGREYICLEPQTCMANCPNSPFDREFSGFSWLEPGERQVFVSKISCVRALEQDYQNYIKNGLKPKE